MTRGARIAISVGAAVAAAAYVLWFGYSTKQLSPGGSDFDQLWFAAKSLWNGSDPYSLIGPGRVFEWPWPLVYPLTTVIAISPFIVFPLIAARVLFAAISAGLFTYALITWRGRAVLPLLGSAAVLDSVRAAQLSPLLTAALLLPAASFAMALKPHIGFPLLASAPRRNSIFAAAGVMLALLIVAFAKQPTWFASWRAALRGAAHVRAPVLSLGGPLLLLTLTRWRRFDARVLLACASVPHTPVVYDVVPVGLVARTFRESIAFSLLTYVALFAQDRFVTGMPPADAATLAARILNLSIYLPALVAVLFRPNVSEDEEIDGVLARWTRARPK